MLSKDPIERVRAVALALPEASESSTWDETQFRVRKKIFVFCGEESISVKPDPEEREFLFADPRFYPPPYLASKGWIGVRLADLDDVDDADDAGELAELVETSYRMIAPQTLVRRLDGERV